RRPEAFLARRLRPHWGRCLPHTFVSWLRNTASISETRSKCVEAPRYRGASNLYYYLSSSVGETSSANAPRTRPARPSEPWVYRLSVVDALSCPITRCTSLTGTPEDTSQVAYECRRSWKRSPPAAWLVICATASRSVVNSFDHSTPARSSQAARY